MSYAGVADLAEMFHQVRDWSGDRSSSYAYWAEFFGTDRIFGSKILHDRSPVHFADQVKASVLLIHVDDDTVVKIKQSKMMYKALKKAGKDVEFITLEGEDHSLSIESTRIETLKAMEGFLAKHLRPTPEAL